ncbi:MAG: hypothetical protein JNK96_01960 [Betaproteobacteria bacterium]|jgi:acyl carrier protein|nr:hypothetical protein [Betaproteobacteria bacterium]HMV19685.1 hypothetical protein [Rhodocyclaceae bacterium]HMW76481.1 hypothetical protein [Rhodocyclaceae bacterium]HNE42410.1 hypothetical protein [Rhodocyclaceae bacterium]HNL21720.1 hypothetical protein [Rhodocyclaceae bacterium]
MDPRREEHYRGLVDYLKTIQKPNKQIETIGMNDGLVASGLIDSLAIVQIVVYLETTYGIDFGAIGVDPERLATIGGILDLIAETKK